MGFNLEFRIEAFKMFQIKYDTIKKTLTFNEEVENKQKKPIQFSTITLSAKSKIG